MTNLEFHGYPEDNEDTIKWTTWTPKVEEGPQQPEKSSSSDVENTPSEGDTATTEVMSEEEAAEMVDSFLTDPETPVALSNLLIIEEKHKSGSLPANIEARYKEARKQAKIKLKNDVTFKQAMAQLWFNLDGFSSTDNSEKRESDVVNEILKSNDTQKQLELVKAVMKENYKTLDPKQQKSLEDGIEVFKTSINKAAKEIWIDQ